MAWNPDAGKRRDDRNRGSSQLPPAEELEKRAKKNPDKVNKGEDSGRTDEK